MDPDRYPLHYSAPTLALVAADQVCHCACMQHTASGKHSHNTAMSSDFGTCLWQVFILDSLATYRPRDSKDAESIVERVTPRLQHANCAVVLSAVKVCVPAAYMPVWYT